MNNAFCPSNYPCLACDVVELEAMLPGALGPYEAHRSYLDLLTLPVSARRADSLANGQSLSERIPEIRSIKEKVEVAH